MESAVEGRGFLKPSEHTKICSDHFHENDFVATDLNKHRENQNLTVKKRHQIRLKKDATPDTNRATGHYSDPLNLSELSNQRPFPTRYSMHCNESFSLELESTDVTVASVAALGQEDGDCENDTEIMDMDLEYILQSESDSNDGDFSDTDSKRYVRNIQSRRKTVTLALLKRFQSRKMNRLG